MQDELILYKLNNLLKWKEALLPRLTARIAGIGKTPQTSL